MSSASQWRVRPAIEAPREGIWLGPGRSNGDGIWLGALAESVTGRRPRVWLSSAKEQVVAVVGKRGSGKSFTLGVLVEGLVCSPRSQLSVQNSPRAVLLFDPLDIYWTTRFGVAPSENDEAQRHYELAHGAGIVGESFNVDAWVPGGSNRRATDPEWFRTLTLSVPGMGLEEWELLLGVNVMNETLGQSFVDALTLVRDNGFRFAGEAIPPTGSFDLADLARAAQSDELEGAYHSETIRALRQRLSALAGTGLFSATGTSIRELLTAGRATVVLLGRLPQSYREAVVALLTRMLVDARSAAAFAEKRIALDPELTEASQREIEAAMAHDWVPKTVVVLDEAQSFLAPGERSAARDLFVRLVKEGRNMGLSAILATQQPSALDRRVLSQVETFVAHQLVTEPDIRAVGENLKSASPTSIQFGSQTLDLAGLLRQLPPGACVVSSADMNTSVRRSIVVSVRPRATVHGGIEL